MLFLDRYWWLRPMLAVAIVLVFSVPLIVLAGDTHYFELIAQGKASFSTGDISNAILVVTYLVLAIGLFISTLPARRRGIQRVAAIQGDLDCIPQANIQAMSGEVTQERIVIQQLLPKRLRWMFFLASIPLLLLVLALICLLAAYEFGE